MLDLFGIINNTNQDEWLGEITHLRSMAAVPFGGRYRLIDFVLSNMVNSGVKNVGILVQHKYGSLMDHLRSGKEWDLDRKRDGLFILPPPYSNASYEFQKGDLPNFHNNLDYLYRSKQKYVLVTGTHIICNIDYRSLLDFHKEAGADITIPYKEDLVCELSRSHSTVIETNPNNRISNMEVNPVKMKSNKMSVNMYLMEKELLIDLIDECISKGEYDFTKGCIVKNIHRLKMIGYRHGGYVASIDSIQNYYKHHLDLLKPEIWKELFYQSGIIYTKVKDTAPAKYMENAKVRNSLIANECIIAGNVENSILFRGVRVHKNAWVKNSIILEQCEIEENAALENVILDKYVHISRDKKLVGTEDYPVVIEKKAFI